MAHGGPSPATSDARSTSVGSAAIERFLRPVCYQAIPQGLLPPALRDGNPLRLWRVCDGESGRAQGRANVSMQLAHIRANARCHPKR